MNEKDDCIIAGSGTEEDSPTDSTWFLPHSPGLPPAASLRPGDDGKLGVLSAINIIVGKTMGVGAYSVPSAIFCGVGSVGMTLLMWLVGSFISFCGLAVYLDLGTAMPRSGGEKVYLERIFKKPYMLATCMFMSYVVLLGFSTPNAIVLGEHALYVVGAAENRWNVRAIAVVAVSALCYIHARHPRVGLGLINTLGVAKILIFVIVVASGVAGGLMGVGAERESLLEGRRADLAMAGDAPSSTAQRNFHAIWEGSSSQPYDYATALLKVVYCFRGYSTANQVLSDVRDPVRTLKIAAPVALALVSAAYLAITAAFFLVVDKDEFRSAGVAVAGVFFRNVFGDGAGARILPLAVVVSAAGNIAATSFAQARVNEELARDGLLPAFWKSGPSPSVAAAAAAKPAVVDDSRPSSPSGKSRAAAVPPSKGLLLHWLVSAATIVLPPPGRIFNFLVDIGGYPVSVVSAAVSLGLLHLHHRRGRWASPCRAPRAAVLISAASNCLLLVLPWVPPRGGAAADVGGAVPSWAYPATSLSVLGLGAAYWVWWRRDGGGGEKTRRRGSGSRRRGVEDLMGAESSDESEDEGSGGRAAPRRGSVGLPVVEATCGCRACPTVRRRALCGCPSCPTRGAGR